MATRGEQKVDEKKLQKAVESWLKKHRAKVQDQKLQSAVNDFVKQHRKEVGERGMRIIRRVISEGRTKPAAKPMTASRNGPTSSSEKPIRAENRRGPSKTTAEKAIKTATDKAKDTVKTAKSRVGALSKLGTGAGLLLVSEPLGGGLDTKDPSKLIKQTERGKKQVPAGGMSTPKPAGKRGRGDGNAEVAARRAEAAKKKKDAARKKANDADATARSDRMLIKKAEENKSKSTKSDAPSGPPRSVREAQKRGLDYFIGRDGKRKVAVTKEQLEKSGMSLREYANKLEGKTRKMSTGGMPQKVNCGASMKPTQRSSKGIKNG